MDLTRWRPFQREIGNNRTLRLFLMCLNVQVSRLVRQKIDRHGSCCCPQRLKIPDRPCPSKCQNLLRFGSKIQLRCRDAHLKVEYPIDKGINKSLRWAGVEDLRIHRIHLFITQKETNKSSKYQIVDSSLSLNNRSSCADGHVRLTYCHFP
jgi:hypothetical protein